MSNAKQYLIDPASLTPAALIGKASLIPDPSAAFWGSLFAGVNYYVGAESLDTTASSLAVDVYRSRLVVSGTMAFTLPNGTTEGQRKLVICESAASTPLATLTVTTPDATTGFVASSTVVFDTPGQSIEYVWTTPPGGTGAWRVLNVHRAGSKAVVVGTTVLTGCVLHAIYALSVTGTVSSTTTKAIPNGQVAGEQIHIVTPTAATIPSGTINITGTTIATGAAATALSAISATTVQAQFQWDPTNSWQNLSVTTATYS